MSSFGCNVDRRRNYTFCSILMMCFINSFYNMICLPTYLTWWKGDNFATPSIHIYLVFKYWKKNVGSLGRVGMSKSRSQPLVCTDIYELALYITKHLHDIFASYGNYSVLFMLRQLKCLILRHVYHLNYNEFTLIYWIFDSLYLVNNWKLLFNKYLIKYILRFLFHLV